ncbi:MAG: hypothetical protein ACE15F_12315 [bacterium]
MRKSTLITLAFLVVLGAGFYQTQRQIIDDRTGRRVEEKILMLSSRPEVTKILALGHEATLADLLWIRAIQYFGGNFSTLDRPEKREGMINLFKNMVALDPKFVAAYKFGGFVMNESIKDPKLAIDFLMEGADRNTANPGAWRLRFDAGFISFYQLKDYESAKRLFLEAVYGENLATKTLPEETKPVLEASGVSEGSQADALLDDDLLGEVKFHPDQGTIRLDLQDLQEIGRINLEQPSLVKESFRLRYAVEDQPQAYTLITSVTTPGLSILRKPVRARFLLLDEMKSEAPDGLFTINEFQVFGPANPEVPSYVERMAYEMDRAAGRFKAAWGQYSRYYKEAVDVGDQISAQLAMQKLDEIFTGKCVEILTEAVELYHKEQGSLPSPQMKELVEAGYLQRILDQKIVESPEFAQDILPILFQRAPNIWVLLTTWDGTSPHLLVVRSTAEGNPDWYITSRRSLEREQMTTLDMLQRYVNQYKEEKGRWPEKLEDLTQETWFPSSQDMFKDPLGGELFIDNATGKVSARNPAY